MNWLNKPSCYDAAMEREAMLSGWKLVPSFPENVPIGMKVTKHESVPGWQRQPPPIKNNLPDIANLVALDIYSRKKMGEEKYGVPLRAYNGRNALKDAYEEALDLCNYLRQALYEKDGE